MRTARLPLAIGLGIVASGAGLMAAATGSRRMALLAAFAGAGAVAASIDAREELDDLDRRATTTSDQIRQLEHAVAAQVQARMTAEEAVRSLNEQLVAAERRAGESSPTAMVLAADDPAAGGLTDPETGLFNHDYFLVSLDSRIAAARRHLRPVAVALVDVVRGRQGPDRPPADPRLVARCLHETLRESDTATRLRDGRFGVLLEDTPENGAIWTMERVRRQLADEDPDLTVWAGVACYPAHAFDVAALVDQAERALEGAREWHQDRIEVATSEP